MIQRIFLAGTLIILAVSSGCGQNIFEGMADDKTPAARLETAKIALDDGNYSEAVSLLGDLCGVDPSQAVDPAQLTCNSATQADLASALVANATGLDAFELIKKAEAVTAGTTNSFGTLSQLMPIDAINACAAGGDCSLQTELSNATAILSGIPSADRTENQNLQLAVAAATDAVVSIGVISGGFSGLDGCDLNTDPDCIPVPAVIPDVAEIDQATTDRLTQDMNNLADGVAGSNLSADLTTQINTIETNMDSDQSSDVSSAELNAYIQDVVNGL